MALGSERYGSQQLQIPPPIQSPSDVHSSDTSFPIIAIAIIGILATAFLLISYYVFVIKCCLNWHRIDLLRRFSFSRNTNQEDPLMAYSTGVEARGLDEAAIRSIPVFKFKKEGSNRDLGGKSFCECAVCLNEFQQDEKLRRIPNCSHVFHVDCIDTWLQGNANCPLCRTSISNSTRFPIDQIIAPSSTPQDPHPYSDESLLGGDEDFVVIELGSHINSTTHQTLLAAQERLNSPRESLIARSISPSPRKFTEQSQRVGHKMGRKFSKITSMGDECIDVRGMDDQFAIIQPIRRSFSMDSSANRHLYLSIQEIVQQSRQVSEVSSPVEGCSSVSRGRRNFFSFGHGRGSRNAVLPVHLDP